MFHLSYNIFFTELRGPVRRRPREGGLSNPVLDKMAPDWSLVASCLVYPVSKLGPTWMHSINYYADWMV